jgi:DNA-binding GntR family transcriptional regulator
MDRLRLRVLEQGAAVGPQLHRMLRDRIIRSDIAPGARISETDIAAEYAVSRQPVREAFIKLSEEGLVEVRPQRGTYVTLISVQTVMTARFIREAVESDLVRGVAEVVTPAGLALLDAQIAAQRALPPDAQSTQFMQLDEAFHRTLAALAGQGAVADYLDALKTQMNRVRHISARPAARARLIAQHAAVVEGIRQRDPDASAVAMRKHLREILADLPEIIATQPGYFDDTAAS